LFKATLNSFPILNRIGQTLSEEKEVRVYPDMFVAC
jgi:hypothetical protein